MDINVAIKSIKNVNDYMSLSVLITRDKPKIPFNMSTVISLKKIKSFEIELFTKHEEHGPAFMIFEALLERPPSKTWGVLGGELALLLQYWCDALRKSLLDHCPTWGVFLDTLLGFIQRLLGKERRLGDALLARLGGGVAALATLPRLGGRRLRALQTLNRLSEAAGRDARRDCAPGLRDCLKTLAGQLPLTAEYAVQQATLELLLRWTPRRRERAARAALAAWLPRDACGHRALEVLLERSFRDFYKDARAFLNAVNEHAGGVTSAPVRRHPLAADSGADSPPAWLDVSPAARCLTLAPEAAAAGEAVDTLTVESDDAAKVVLKRYLKEVQLIIAPHATGQRADDGTPATTVELYVGAGSDLRRLDRALRETFGDKYECQINMEKIVGGVALSPHEATEGQSYSESEDEATSKIKSDLASQMRRLRRGVAIRPKFGFNSPSTASTTSLAQLHERLAALPPARYDKEAWGVCAPPALATVPELSEPDSLDAGPAAAARARPCGVIRRPRRAARTSPSDQESPAPHHNRTASSGSLRCISPVAPPDCQSALYLATASADASSIDDTLEKLAKGGIDTLIKEALKTDRLEDSGVVTGEPSKVTQAVVDSEIIENTPVVVTNVAHGKGKVNCTVISKSTSNESYTDALINDVPPYPVIDADVIHEFFSQHISARENGDIVISPTLARKINASSSDSESVDQWEILEKEVDHSVINNVVVDPEDIQSCVNFMIDQVCEATNNFIVELGQKNTTNSEHREKGSGLEDYSKVITALEIIEDPLSKSNKLDCTKTKAMESKKKATKNIPTKRKRAKKNNAKLDIVVEKNETTKKAIKDCETPINKTNNKEKTNTPNTRRQRKLYSPKDDVIEKPMNSDGDDDVPLADIKAQYISTPKILPRTSRFNATCYRDLEKQRDYSTRSRRRPVTPALSPRSLKQNQIFEHLLEDRNESVKLVDPSYNAEAIAVYNFTSDSEDGDFKKKKIFEIKMQKSNSNTSSVAGGKSQKRTTRKKAKAKVKSPSTSPVKRTKTNTRKPTKRQKQKKTTEIERSIEDERVRGAAPEQLNDTFDNKLKDCEEKENVNPKIAAPHISAMEPINDVSEFILGSPLKVHNDNNKCKDASVETDSLPPLIIETRCDQIDAASTTSSNLMRNCVKMVEQGDNYINNTTQNLLSDNDRLSETADVETCMWEIQEKPKTPVKSTINQHSDSRTANEGSNGVTTRKKYIPRKRSSFNDWNEIDLRSEYTLCTVGKSPITAHGTLDESPPGSKDLYRNIPHRNLDLEDMSPDKQKYFEQLRNAMEAGETSEKEDLESGNRSSTPLVRVRRLSDDEIAQYLPSPKSSITSEDDKISHPANGNESCLNMDLNIFGDEIAVTPSKSPITRYRIKTANHHNRNASSPKPIVRVERLSVQEIEKWLKPPKTPARSTYPPCAPRKKQSTERRPYLTQLTLWPEKIRAETDPSDTPGPVSRRSVISPINLKWSDVESENGNIEETPHSMVMQPTKFASNISMRSLRSRKRCQSVQSSHDTPPRRRKLLPNNSGSETVASSPEYQCTRRPSRRSIQEEQVLSSQDIIDDILEQVETTISNINESTTKKFVDMFLRMEESRRAITTEWERDVKTLSDKYEGLHRAAAAALRRDAARLVRDDARQKRLLLRMLRDDARAARRDQ